MIVFGVEALLFLVAASLVLRSSARSAAPVPSLA
jgi:hypothetical protein